MQVAIKIHGLVNSQCRCTVNDFKIVQILMKWFTHTHINDFAWSQQTLYDFFVSYFNNDFRTINDCCVQLILLKLFTFLIKVCTHTCINDFTFVLHDFLSEVAFFWFFRTNDFYERYFLHKWADYHRYFSHKWFLCAINWISNCSLFSTKTPFNKIKCTHIWKPFNLWNDRNLFHN